MRARGGTPGRVVTLAMGLALLTPAAGPARAAVDAPRAVAFTLDLEGTPQPGMPADAATVRAEAESVVSALLGAQDRPCTDPKAIMDLLRRHRVRSAASVPPGLLADLRTGERAGTLLAATVLADAERLTVMMRSISTSDGRLEGVGIAEAAIGADWRRALAKALREAMPGPVRSAGGAPRLLVMPGIGVGMDAQAARAATTCVLSAALADTQWAVIDPSVLMGAAIAAGRNPARLDKAGRALLVERFGVDWVMLPEVVTYGDAAGTVDVTSGLVVDGGVATAASAADLTISLRLMDLRSGRVRGAVSLLVPGAAKAGWFGMLHPVTELGQMREGAASLWPRFEQLLEELAS